MKSNRWEMGSSFHEISTELTSSVSNVSWNDSELYLSGRYAIFDLVLYKKAYEDLTDIYIPSYYCHDVTRLIESQIEVKFYECSPISIIDLSLFPRDATVILVEYMGNKVRTIGDNSLKVIIDKTHNPLSKFSYSFIPEFQFGSLRKIFPTGEGGFLFPKLYFSQKKASSINGDSLKSLKRAMHFKKVYLHGGDIEKKDFLKEFNAFEELLNNTTDIYNISEDTLALLSTLDVDTLYNHKKKNLDFLYSYYGNSTVIKIFKNNSYFSFFVLLEDYAHVRSKLINNNVYPIVLWPNYEGDIYLINGYVLVSLHVDFRYDLQDLKKLTNILDGIFCEL
ncbi:hypothetical protein [Acinetobacter lwoffii]|uniref:Uncharacterized protein n=1 Tax=Acinetobacter lwoffii TaxID=28090 RepID=A0AAW3VI28_ACILW|nr:hypothetical protein [Acinetobacter lwoffii]MBB6364080.1 hypothetical protein [Acinetobacter lwoffii]